MQNILFVDDDPLVLAQLRRSLRHMRDYWNMHYVLSGAEALIALEDEEIDVIISDVLMPKMSGLQLLDTVKRFFPNVVRIIFTAQTDPVLARACNKIAHNCLSKFCKAEDIKQVVSEAIARKSEQDGTHLLKKVEQVDVLPSMPDLYDRLLDYLKQPDATALKAGDLIAQDVSMTAKVLHMVNSAAFGLRRQIDSPADAVIFIGLENLKALTLGAKAFSRVEVMDYPDNFLMDLWEHSSLTGILAKKIAQSQGADKEFVDCAFSAGLLHDLGKIILITDNEEGYKRVVKRVQESHEFFSRVERDWLGKSHAEVGAHLLKNWGLSERLVNTVKYHHSPRMSPHEKTFSPLTCVHIANVHSSKKVFAGRGFKSIVDIEYLWEIGMHNKVRDFEFICTSSTL